MLFGRPRGRDRRVDGLVHPGASRGATRVTAHEDALEQMGEAYAALRKVELPKLKPHSFLDWPSPTIPHRIGWLNYWYAKKIAGLSRNALITPRGAWLVKTTNEPLDLRRADHVEAIADAYRTILKA